MPPPLASLMPPVSGLRQPTESRFAFEKFVPARGPAENISGASGASGSTLAAPSSSRVVAMRWRPARTSASPERDSVRTLRDPSSMWR